jgi:hypothetical protein
MIYILGKSREAHLPIDVRCTAFLAREAALFYRELVIVGKRLLWVFKGVTAG